MGIVEEQQLPRLSEDVGENVGISNHSKFKI